MQIRFTGSLLPIIQRILKSIDRSSKSIIKIFDIAMFVVPGLWAVAGIILLVAYFREWGTNHYWRAFLPLPFTVAFVVWMMNLAPKP